MQKPSATLGDGFARRLKSLDVSRKTVESLHTSGDLSEKVVLQLYEGLFLNAHVALERFLEDLFIGLLVHNMGVTSSRSDVVPRLEIRSYKVARDLLVGPKGNYVDWLPYAKTLSLAKLYFRKGRPFTELTPQQKETLHKSYLIRNAVAHSSQYSLKRFRDAVVQSRPLPTKELGSGPTPTAKLRDGHPERNVLPLRQREPEKER